MAQGAALCACASIVSDLVVDRFDAVKIRHFPKYGRTDPGDAEGQPEKQTRDKAHFARHQILRVDKDGGEGGSQDETNDESQDRRGGESDVRQSQRKGRHTEDGEPDDRLATDAIAQRSPGNGAESDGKKKRKR